MSASSPRAKKDVGAHFDRSAPAFDAIYTGESMSPLRRLVHRVFFHDIHWRLALTLAECDALAGASVLDIGCGSGVYLEELGRRGAARLVGLDFATAMIELAQRRVAAAGLAHLTELRTTDFLAYPVEVPFDYTLAVGVFDYFRDPGPLLQKMASITRQKAIATFPQLWNPWTAVRRARYALAVRDCPVHFYRLQVRPRQQVRRRADAVDDVVQPRPGVHHRDRLVVQRLEGRDVREGRHEGDPRLELLELVERGPGVAVGGRESPLQNRSATSLILPMRRSVVRKAAATPRV